MRIPLSWLGEYVDLEQGVTTEAVHAALVSVGLEEEDVHRFEVSGPVVVGEVLDLVPEPQKNGKTINWCTVRVAPEGERAADGGDDVRGIVCGAHNFAAGDKVVVSLPGAVLPGPFPISARKTYGHVSDGMIASTRELGLGDDHEGILRLASLGIDPEVGTDAIVLLGLDDAAVEVNVTPDRGYAFSIRGIAREYAHATGADFRDPALAITAPERLDSAPVFPVAVEDEAPIRGRVGSSVFVTRVVRGIDPSLPTPPWMIARLRLAGVRSISLVVDITNYVMFELGQPLHGYDLERLEGGIVVRRARVGETLETLDGQTRRLHHEDLLITDDGGPIGLAGVMGGARTEITDTTADVLIEAANFDPVSIARTARRHKLPSEASRRFERGVDPLVAPVAAARAVQLLVELAGGTADELGSVLADAATAAAIELPDGYISGLIGLEYTPEEIRGALVEIGASVEAGGAGLLVTPPSWRPDLTDRSTLAEEVARITGYDRIPSILPVAPPGRGLTPGQRLRRTVAQSLAAAGLTEVLSYPFLSRSINDRFGSVDGAPVQQVSLANPLDATAGQLRLSLLPGLVQVAARNRSRGLVDLAVYEMGSVFLPQSGAPFGSEGLPLAGARPSAEIEAALNAGIPRQPLHVAALLTGSALERQPGVAARDFDWRDALDVVRDVAAASGVQLEIRQGSHAALHPGRTAEVLLDGAVVGHAGELLPSLADDLDLPHRVAVVELDLDPLIARAGRLVVARPVGALPAATQDLSLVVPVAVPAADLQAAVAEGAGELLEAIRLVDDYRGAGVPEGSKSLTFALRFRAADRTLTAAEASAAKESGTALAAERFGASPRE
ncbi:MULTISPECIES: phenylalanine--tRNA ligase subunit beta [unclassified Rathayibacter]|uniref:phenylalanine--tRNA ligase subunit beta n=1 Tax=unclassified Rathayibacter TaxID=2609250 RepID=UPI00104EAEFA|nr:MULTISPECIES: phenylalanine--tRNA ligase subunit beta [unclassified Rathayibacter]MCJ1704742.1 phenylalanine--tRNA ligase subunit beta [Rathayibacter sp. VKM Ac-2926]TCL78764.1 phenylalanyl-tRNA synthetase beta subunit [Rathayibacter sp. PhB192]TCM25070.1 phenylalanyl-tRNA synthetase beta subunit [Rathayibacter sp. PhB179]